MIKNQSNNLHLSRFTKYAWFVLIYNIFVILWGAYVRATGSGAGCGSHWPTCNGEIIPRADEVETLIEFTHRLTSGLAFLLVLGMLIWALRAYPKGHRVRKASGAAMIFIISESLVGAGLVLFEWVAGNISASRVIVMGPDKKGYWLPEGAQLKDGFVLSIDLEAGEVIFRQDIDDPLSIKPFRDISRLLNPAQEGAR